MKAFPKVNVVVDNDTVIESDSRDGMDLRDYFAAKAMQGLIAGCYAGNNVGFTVEGNVFAAYEYADAMLRAREMNSNLEHLYW